MVLMLPSRPFLFFVKKIMRNIQRIYGGIGGRCVVIVLRGTLSLVAFWITEVRCSTASSIWLDLTLFWELEGRFLEIISLNFSQSAFAKSKLFLY